MKKQIEEFWFVWFRGLLPVALSLCFAWEIDELTADRY